MSLEINTDDFWKDRAQKLEMALADTEALEAGTAERCRRWRESHKMSQLRVVELTAENARLRAALIPEGLLDLLAIIHRDGGHYIAEHGVDKAINDAKDKVWTMLAAARSNP